MIYITSDLHFHHTNIAKFCPKYRSGFATVNDMNTALLNEWNETIKPEDEVYFLGDMTFAHRGDVIEHLLNSLNGKITWILGNHDKNALKFARQNPRIFVRDYLEINHAGHRIVLSHFPIFSWNGIHRGALHLHGHAHGSIEQHNVNTRRTDVGWDVHGRILTLDEAVAMTAAKPISSPEGDHHNQARGSI